MRLYELSEAYLNIMSLIDDEDTDQEQVTIALQNIDEAIEIKADNYAKMMKALSAEVDALKEEERRLAARRKRNETSTQWLKDNLEATMRMIGKTKFKTSLFSFGIQKNPASVEINCDIGSLPEEYKKITIAADKSKLKEALQNGIEIEGVHLKQSESLRIR